MRTFVLLDIVIAAAFSIIVIISAPVTSQTNMDGGEKKIIVEGRQDGGIPVEIGLQVWDPEIHKWRIAEMSNKNYIYVRETNKGEFGRFYCYIPNPGKRTWGFRCFQIGYPESPENPCQVSTIVFTHEGKFTREDLLFLPSDTGEFPVFVRH